jgi:hypothetical protein
LGELPQCSKGRLELRQGHTLNLPTRQNHPVGRVSPPVDDGDNYDGGDIPNDVVFLAEHLTFQVIKLGYKHCSADAALAHSMAPPNRAG